jgi:hypothetical protein
MNDGTSPDLEDTRMSDRLANRVSTLPTLARS